MKLFGSFLEPLIKLFGKPLDKVPPNPANLDIIQFNSTTGKWELQSGVIGNAVQSSSNVGTGDGLALARVLDDLPFKSLKAGTNITLTPSATEILLEATGGAFDILADDTLGATADQFDSSVFATREFLLIFIHLESVGGGLDTRMRFNAQAGAIYAYRRSTNYGAGSTFINDNEIEFDIGNAVLTDFAIVWIDNKSGVNKLFRQDEENDSGGGAGSVGGVGSVAGKVILTAQVTQINLANTGVGSYLGGDCRILVLGSKT